MKQATIIIILFTFFGNCKPDFWKEKIYDNYKETVSSVGDLTDEQVLKYIKVVRELHKLGPSLPEKIADHEGDPGMGNAVFTEIEKEIKDGGFKDYTEFVKVNAKVAWAWNVSQGEKGIQDFKTMKDIGVEKLNEALANPNIPEETKVELRKTLAETEANWAKNKKYADMTLTFVKPFTNENDLAVIKRHYKELMEGFTGRSLEELNQIDPKQFLSDFKPSEL
jgi:hypothetical protein